MVTSFATDDAWVLIRVHTTDVILCLLFGLGVAVGDHKGRREVPHRYPSLASLNWRSHQTSAPIPYPAVLSRSFIPRNKQTQRASPGTAPHSRAICCRPAVHYRIVCSMQPHYRKVGSRHRCHPLSITSPQAGPDVPKGKLRMRRNWGSKTIIVCRIGPNDQGK